MVSKRRRRFARRVVRKVPTAVRKYVARALSRGVETKHRDFYASFELGPNQTTVIKSYVAIPSITQGVGADQRVGDRLNLSGLKMKCRFQWTNANSVNGGRVRVIICYAPSNGPWNTLGEIEDALFENGVTLGVGAYTDAIRGKTALRILYDKVVSCQSLPMPYTVGGGATQVRYQSWDMYVPLRGLKQEYDDGGANPIKGQFLIYMCSNSLGAVTDLTAQYNARLYFKDG